METVVGIFGLALIVVAAVGGFISLFAGRRYYTLWLGLAVYFFMLRVLDLALFRLPQAARDWGGLLIAALVVVVVYVFRGRLARYVPTIGGFIVSALITERLLAILYPEAGKFLFAGLLLVGGLAGVFLFLKLFDVDEAIIVLSALWGAGFLSSKLADFTDLVLITAVGLSDTPMAGFLRSTQVLQTLLWFVLAAIGIFVQFKIVRYGPLPAARKTPLEGQVKAAVARNRRALKITAVIVGLLGGFLLLSILVGNSRFSRNVRSTLVTLERSLGLEAESPGDAPWEWAATLLRPELRLQDDDRLLVLVPHPDDDILSAAGTLQQAVEMGLPVRVVYFTNGDYNETSFAIYRKEINLTPVEALRLGETRREEAIAAQGLLGVTPEQITFLGYPDGGGLEIFERHWGESVPYQALLSRQEAVPYTFTQTPGAPFKGESILADLEQTLRDFRPTKIITSHPGDVHPDHQSLPLYLQVALWDVQDALDPDVYHFITHYGRWPQPRGYQPEHPLDPPAQFDVGNRWHVRPLTMAQREKKLAALQAHVTQWGSGQPYLESVVRANELFDVLKEVPVREGEPVTVLPAEAGVVGEALALYPSDAQRAFVETEVRALRLDGEDLVLSLEFQEPLERGVSAKVWALGYRKDVQFGDMPKLFMDLSEDGVFLYDQGRPLPQDAVTVAATPLRSEVRVPLSLLGDPERLMVSSQTAVGDVPLDNVPWVFLRLER